MSANRGRVLLEVAIGSVEDALVAVANGADRLELNSALALGGLTPTPGLLAEVRAAVAVPIVAMVRPRPAGCAYSASEIRVMHRDIDALLAGGADGIAFGVLTETGAIDVPRCRELVERIGPA